MFRNPISSKRLQFLTTQLEKKLKKHPELLRKTQPKLVHLADADPSPSGEYSGWILNLLLKKDIDLPEDAGKLNELLATFHKVKQRLPQEFRDINKFTSYTQLRVTLLPMLPTLKSVAELELEGSNLLTTEVINDAVYQIYKLTTPEAASAAAKGSGWCVCNQETAANYLKDGPLYLFSRNDKRHALGHVESYQLMDVNDIPINPDDGDHYYKDMLALLDKHIPELVCDDVAQHKEYLKGKPPSGNNIANIVCHDCDEAGCYDCGYASCTIEDDCSNQMCLKHRAECEQCEKAMCSEHTLACCRAAKRKSNMCTDCSMVCAKCDEKTCEECGRYVECCDENVCESHESGYCEGCSSSLCSEHAVTMAKCGSCNGDQYYCEDCREDWIICDNCSEYCCRDCAFTCHCCRDLSCKSCSEVCKNCSERICYNCSNYCQECKEHYCDDCSRHDCGGDKPLGKTRPHHFHGDVYECEIGINDQDADCYGVEYCEDCISECIKCDKKLCGLHARYCGCEGAHTICENCILTNHCTGCGGTFCRSEEHIQCAYVRRRLRRRFR